MNVVKFKGCRRCGGDLFLERDPDGISITCLQCSATYYKRLGPPIRLKFKANKVYVR
ncbi:MAG: hypothetical protein ABR958_04420 [Dehalococcoidales bacterium]|jgi:hypothetical protein